MAVSNPYQQLRGSAPTINRTPITGRVTKIDEAGVWVVPIGGDQRTPVGPCRGPADIPVGTICMVIWTQERPWVFGAELVTTLTADLHDVQLLEQAGLDAQVRVDTHAGDTTAVHGIADTTQLETKTGAQTKANAARDQAIGTLLGGAPPAALDTLLEIAEKLQDEDDAIAALTLLIAAKETPAGAQAKVDAHAAAGARPHGDTGLRQVVTAAGIADLPNLEVVVRRRGDVVSVFTRETAAAAHAGATALYALPAGFRPDAPRAAAPVVDQAAAPIPGAVLTVTSAGDLQLTAVAGVRHYAALTYLTDDAFPSILPGTED